MKQIPTINLSAYARKMLINGYIIVLDLQEVKAHTAQIVGKSCITAQTRTLKRGNTTLFAPLQGSKGKRFARRILSAPLSWNRVYWLICGLSLPVCLPMRNALWRQWVQSRKSKQKENLRRNGIAEATPFPENNLMLFYECRPYGYPFVSRCK